MSYRQLAAGGLALLLAASAPAARADALNLDAYRGKVVYLDFWASWCVPCRVSFPWLDELQTSYRREGLVVIAVDVDKDPAAAARFLSRQNPGFQIVADPKGQIAESYKVSGMPMSMVIGRNGKVRFSHAGFYEKDEATYLGHVTQLLAEKP